jgi:hypothetical protein
MSACAVCGGSNREERKGRCGVRDSGSEGARGVDAEGDQAEANQAGGSLGRALRRQRSRWVRLTGSQRLRRVLVYGLAPMLLLLGLPLVMGASTDDQLSLCPADGAATVESVPTMLDDSGAVQKIDLTDQAAIGLIIFADKTNPSGPVDLRLQMGSLMRGLHQVAVCFPQIKTIRADLMAPGERRHDEYGNAIAGSEVAVVSLRVTADDLRAFRQNFEWESYPVYAANRYARAINVSLTDVWHRELEMEEESGDFVSSL